MHNKQSASHWLSEFEFSKIKQQLEERLQAGGNLNNLLKEPPPAKNKNGETDFGEVVYGNLGVCGGTYIIANKIRNQLVSLQNEEMQQELASEFRDVPFIEIPHSSYLYDPVYYKNKRKTKKLIDTAKEYYPIIDALHIAARDVQIISGGDSPKPEFYVHLPSINSEKQRNKTLPFERYLTQNKFEVIYCSVGEILFFLMVWRMLFYYIKTDGKDATISLDDEYFEYSSHYQFWEVVADEEGLPESRWLQYLDRKRGKNKHELDKKWPKISSEVDNFKKEKFYSYYEYKKLGLIDNRGNATRELLSLVRYAIHIAEKVLKWESIFNSKLNAKTVEFNTGKLNSDEQAYYRLLFLERHLDYYFQEKELISNDRNFKADRLRDYYQLGECLNRVFRSYLFKELNYNKRTNKEKALVLLSKVHKASRFPILPYFYELTAGEIHRPKEHLVLSVWQSKENKIKLEDRTGQESQSTAVVFVVLTLRPIWRIFPEANFIENSKSEHLHRNLSEEAYIHVSRLREFFSVLSKPIIDQLFYGQLIRREISRHNFMEYIKAFSHELSKITDNIFERSNMRISEVFKGREAEFVNYTSSLFPANANYAKEKILNWRIIHTPDIFNTWALLLRVWSGRREEHIFPITDFSLHQLIETSANLACTMHIGEEFKGASKPRAIDQIIIYEDAFTSAVNEKSSEIQLKFDKEFSNVEDDCVRLKMAQNSDELIWEQNTLIRLLLACLTNIYEHATGSFYCRLEKGKDKGEVNYLRFVFVNPATAKEVKNDAKESLGTKPVLESCIEHLDGVLENFGKFNTESETVKLRKEKWLGIVSLNADEDLWETSFRIPFDKLFQDT